MLRQNHLFFAATCFLSKSINYIVVFIMLWRYFAGHLIEALENYRVSKKNDATFDRYLFLDFNLNWYAFNIYYTGNQYPLRISN